MQKSQAVQPLAEEKGQGIFRTHAQMLNGKMRDIYFSMLGDSLRSFVLPTSDGVGRLGQASEFMLMSFDSHTVYFKHGDTRNYLFMAKLTGKLTVPKGGAFFQGEFDIFHIHNDVVFKKWQEKWGGQDVR